MYLGAKMTSEEASSKDGSSKPCGRPEIGKIYDLIRKKDYQAFYYPSRWTVARTFGTGHALPVIYVPGWRSWHFFPHTCQSVIVVVFFIESNGFSDGIFSIFVVFLFSLILTCLVNEPRFVLYHSNLSVYLACQAENSAFFFTTKIS